MKRIAVIGYGAIGVAIASVLAACSKDEQHAAAQAPAAQAAPAQAAAPVIVQGQSNSGNDMFMGGVMGYLLGRSSGAQSAAPSSQVTHVTKNVYVTKNVQPAPAPVAKPAAPVVQAPAPVAKPAYTPPKVQYVAPKPSYSAFRGSSSFGGRR